MNPKLKKTVKILKITASTLWWCVLIALFVLLGSIFRAKITGNVPSVFGYSIINVVSGSMEDEIPKGSYILIKKTEDEKIKKGDVISFYSTDPQIYGFLNTHRVVEDPIVTESGIEFVTKGDASPGNDTETAKGERLVGVYVKRLDILTGFANGLSSGALIITIICLLISTFLLFVFLKLFIKTDKKDKHNRE